MMNQHSVKSFLFVGVGVFELLQIDPNFYLGLFEEGCQLASCVRASVRQLLLSLEKSTLECVLLLSTVHAILVNRSELSAFVVSLYQHKLNHKVFIMTYICLQNLLYILYIANFVNMLKSSQPNRTIEYLIGCLLNAL